MEEEEERIIGSRRVGEKSDTLDSQCTTAFSMRKAYDCCGGWIGEPLRALRVLSCKFSHAFLRLCYSDRTTATYARGFIDWPA